MSGDFWGRKDGDDGGVESVLEGRGEAGHEESDGLGQEEEREDWARGAGEARRDDRVERRAEKTDWLYVTSAKLHQTQAKEERSNEPSLPRGACLLACSKAGEERA